MSKTKNKNRSELEFLNGKIRELESENRQLRKRLKQLDKKAHLYEGLIDAVAEEIKPEVDKCNKCKEGILQHVDLKHAKFLVCGTCKNRTKV